MVLLISHTDPLAEVTLKILSAYLFEKKIDNRCIYLPSRAEELEIGVLEKIAGFARESELVGISLLSNHFKYVKKLSTYIRSVCDTPIVWGGVHPSANPPEKSLAYCDFVCVGEGEEPLYCLYQALKTGKFEDVPNLAYMKDGKVVQNPVSFIQKDLDALPFPNYEFKHDYIYYQGDLVEINGGTVPKKDLLGQEACVFGQRGCPLNCSFCSVSFMRGLYGKNGNNKVYFREIGVNKFLDEIERVKGLMPFIKHYHILDDDFLARSEEDIELFGKMYREKIGVPLSITSTVKNFTEGKLLNLLDAPLIKVCLGIQTGSDRILKRIYNRPIFRDDILNNAKILSKYSDRVKVSYDIILDNPYETEEDQLDTVRLLNQLPRPFDLSIFTMVWLPGTRLTKRAQKDGLIPQDDDVLLEKRYHIDFQKSYMNSIIILNGVFNLPTRVNDFFVHPMVRSSALFAPFRFLIKHGQTFFLILKALKIARSSPRLLLYYIKQFFDLTPRKQPHPKLNVT